MTFRSLADSPLSRLASVPPWRWIFFWLLLPNIVILAMWPVGGPVMRDQLILFGLVAMCAAQLPWTWVKRTVLLIAMLVITTYYVCLSFNLPIWGFLYLPQFFQEVKPWRAPLYLVGAVLFTVATFIALRFAPRVPRFASFFPTLLALGAIHAVAEVDAKLGAAIRDSYVAAPQLGQPQTSSATILGIDRPTEEKRNVVLILVEALGMPANPVEKALFARSWAFPDLADRYEIQRGTVPYYGSTTSAELRALCGRFGYYDRFDFDGAECLPEIYKKAGYETSALHSFSGNFFERWRWYPLLKFDHIAFAPELKAAGAKECGGLFPGACDETVPALIGEQLKVAQNPQFVYWLTLNSHLPVVADDGLGTRECTMGPTEWNRAYSEICRIFLVHDKLAQAIAVLATDPELPPTDFLIVGDHMAPFFDRESRMRFEGGTVPWIYLRSQADAVSAHETASASS